MSFFDLRSMRARSGEEHREPVEVEVAPVALGGERYIVAPEPVPAELAVTRASTGWVFELRLHMRLHGPCMRCLADAVVERDLALREYQAADPQGSDELATPYVREDRLDLSAWARDALILELPDKILCRSECAGICPTCGKDLNREPHVHDDEAGDSRWAALEELKHRL